MFLLLASSFVVHYTIKCGRRGKFFSPTFGKMGKIAMLPIANVASSQLGIGLPERAAGLSAGYSPNLTLKNWRGGLPGGVTSMVVITALFFPFTVTPLDIGEALFSPSTVLAE